MPSTKTRPIEKFAKAASKCSVETGFQAAAYGKCVVADYNAVQKDMCAKEFMKLKDCFLAASKKV
ncbi:hypothetical protein AtubIFM56815_000501 [Aspergillus tubingensis]|uniref:IMS import disulfide relay-system CHCH-CHCH-like Cx9C domain-containing protein n=1 Tax=Aspergillus tubingensis TaxID=5068 RepID=A0A9W6AHP6_ASPTU|nr:hypothetical protein AtubIFM56815_000501 [Aspergillus tubingensis]